MTALPITLKVNNRTEFFALQDLVISTLIFIGSAIFILFYLDAESIFYILIGFYFFLYFLPVIVLHSNYKKYNKNKILILEKNSIVFDNKIIELDKIIKSNVYGTYQSLNNQSSGKLPYQTAYFYIEIVDSENQIMYLTNLLSKDLIRLIQENYPSLELKKIINTYPKIKNYG